MALAANIRLGWKGLAVANTPPTRQPVCLSLSVSLSRHTHCLSLSLTHTHTLSLSLTHTHTNKHTHCLSLPAYMNWFFNTSEMKQKIVPENGEEGMVEKKKFPKNLEKINEN